MAVITDEHGHVWSGMSPSSCCHSCGMARAQVDNSVAGPCPGKLPSYADRPALIGASDQDMLHAKVLGFREGPAFPSPAYQGDCGLDLAAAEDFVIEPGDTANVHTGVAIALPPGTFGWITGRSSTWSRLGVQVMPGIIDEGWRGELMIMLHVPYLGPKVNSAVGILAGTRLAQLIVLPNYLTQLKVVDLGDGESLPPGSRGELGFGSSGI